MTDTTKQSDLYSAMAGRVVSVDVSTGDDDAGHRIFAELTGEVGSDGTTLIAVETERNFAAPTAPEAEATVVPNPIDCLREAMTAAGAPTDLRPMLVGYFSNAWNKRIGTSAAVSAAPVAVAPVESADASSVAGEGLTARVYKRESTQEWVLEIAGTINDTRFISRHTEPLETPMEDVAGLPSLYAERQPQPADEEVAQLRALVATYQRNRRAAIAALSMPAIPAAIQQSQQAGKEGA